MRGNQEQIFNRGGYQYQPYQNNYPRYSPPNSRQNYYGYYPNQNAYNNRYRPGTRNSTPGTKTNSSISLKSLESLRERGLISEESYLKKLKELGY